MSEKRLGVGFVGGGFITGFHIKSWLGVRHADVLGVTDPVIERAEASAELARNLKVGDAKAYKSVTDMVADPNIDAIWICAPNFTRLEIMQEIVDAIESGKGSLIGVTCEKPLGRNVKEARQMLELAQKVNILDGYLEDQLFSPSVERGREIVWARAAATTGRPYLARAAEEHGGPHSPWFWEGTLQGGGVINDMMCHSVEVARHILTKPGAPRESLTPIKVNCYSNCLKWQLPKYAQQLSDMSGGKLDYANRPSEDFGRAVVEFKDENDQVVVVECTTSWSYVGAGLRLSMELLGPEYSMQINSLDTDLNVFFSRHVVGDEGEDLIEKQNAEQGLMPVVSHEASAYGYEGENRYFVDCFLAGKRPEENFSDGLNVTELLMAAYMSAEKDETVDFQSADLENYIPPVARGEWNPKK